MKHFPRLVLVLILFTVAYIFNRYDVLNQSLEWIEGFGSWGPILFLGVYVLSCVFFVPSLIFTFGAGVLFPLPLAILLAALGNALGSACALLIGRYMMRGWVSKQIQGNRQFESLDHAVHEKGWKIVALARLTPIFPFLFMNYAFGVSKIKVIAYFLASLLGTLPSATVYSYLGSLLGDFSKLGAGERSPGEWALLVVGFIATIVLSLYLKRIAEKALGSTARGN